MNGWAENGARRVLLKRRECLSKCVCVRMCLFGVYTVLWEIFALVVLENSRLVPRSSLLGVRILQKKTFEKGGTEI